MSISKTTFVTFASVFTASFASAASFTVYDNKAAFLSDTAAADLTSPYLPVTGSVQASVFDFGSVSVFSNRMFINEYTTLLSGPEIGVSFGINGSNDLSENIDIVFDSDVYSAGFDIVETTEAISGVTPINSTFSVTFVNNGVNVESFHFNVEDDVAAFVGVWSDTPFDTLKIRELDGNNDNEYFGHIYAGTQAPQVVPSPTAVVAGFAGLGYLTLRKRRYQK